MPRGEYPYDVAATELDGTRREFKYVHKAEEPLSAGAKFQVRHEAELVARYEVVRVVSDTAVEARATGIGTRVIPV